MNVSFPGESRQYRAARNRGLDQEIALRRAMERVAAARRALPPGGITPEDYRFQGVRPDGSLGDVRLSELFAPGKNSLAIYSFSRSTVSCFRDHRRTADRVQAPAPPHA